MAPEARRGGGVDPRPADIWSLGVSLVVALLARNPFAAAAKGLDPSFLGQWQSGLEAALQQAPVAAAPGAGPAAMLHAALRNAAPKLYPILLRMLDTRPERRATARELEPMLKAMEGSGPPDASPLLRELRAQVQHQAMPVARAIAQDPWLMQTQPGERAAGRPALRRANSMDTLVRPFVQPFDSPPAPSPQEHVAQAKALRDWHESPTFSAVQQFLYEQEEQWLEHLARHPAAAERLYGGEG
jgi:serine/threonine protein kinase